MSIFVISYYPPGSGSHMMELVELHSGLVVDISGQAGHINRFDHWLAGSSLLPHREIYSTNQLSGGATPKGPLACLAGGIVAGNAGNHLMWNTTFECPFE